MSTLKEVRLAALADLHCGKQHQGVWQPLFAKIGEAADVLLLCGDLTNYGLPEEASVLIRELAPLKMPVIAVLGNHDFESGKQDELRNMFVDAGLQMLDGDACEVHGIGFAGVKGFAGGFGPRMLGPWGEDLIKKFVHEALNEALKLESALARLRTDKRIVLLHYSPIQQTVEGEPPEIFAFLGCSRLEEPLNRFPVTAVFHGHAHHGHLAGKTRSLAPVHNVAYPVLLHHFPQQPFYLETISLSASPDSTSSAESLN